MNLPESTKKIAKYLKSSDKSKPNLALELWETKNSHRWKNTRYGSWRNYCDNNVALSQASIYKYMYTGKMINRFGYELSTINKIVTAIGWARFQLGITKINVHLTAEKFIFSFKDLNLNERVEFEKDQSDLVNFTFSVPKADADILTDELVVRGMRIHKHNRINISAAMIKLIREISEKSEY